MAVAFDANATADTTQNAVATITNGNLTIGSGSNRALIVQLSFSNQALSALTVKWDVAGANQSLTLIGTVNVSGARSELWGLINPASGNKIVTVNWTGSSDVCCNATAWTGVDQTGGATSFPNFTSATNTTGNPSLTITSAVGNATMAVATNLSSISAPTQTQTFLDTTPSNISGAGSRAAGAATVTHGWTSGGGAWSEAGCDIAAAGGGGGATPIYAPTMTLLGVQ